MHGVMSSHYSVQQCTEIGCSSEKPQKRLSNHMAMEIPSRLLFKGASKTSMTTKNGPDSPLKSFFIAETSILTRKADLIGGAKRAMAPQLGLKGVQCK